VSFAVSGDAYDRFMGRYSTRLAPLFADYIGIRSGQRVLDVGSGPGALTGELVKRVGASNVVAVDPSESFVAAARERFPELDVRRAAAEHLPLDDNTFDAALAQLVVHFMSDPLAGVKEMARVVRDGGALGACVWDHAGEGGPLTVFWRAAHEIDPHVDDESQRMGAREGQLAELFAKAGLHTVTETSLVATATHATFDEWWTPFTLGVGPAGEYTQRLPPDQRNELRERCRHLLPEAPFAISARAWTARGLA
jgi:SAM-dependent methyltransferase